jgi:hypothetical protein
MCLRVLLGFCLFGAQSRDLDQVTTEDREEEEKKHEKEKRIEVAVSEKQTTMLLMKSGSEKKWEFQLKEFSLHRSRM